MISKQDVLDRAGEWQLRPEVVEKDYVLGWLLAAIARHPETSAHWVFKGGTSLKKCYFETYRFSEDLDFSLLESGRYSEEDLRAILLEITAETATMSGLRFPEDAISVRSRRDKLGRPTFEGKVGYQGPLAYPGVRRILFDLTQHEPVLDGVHPQGVHHPYPDGLPEETRVPAYSLDELFAEKTRALFERSRPRDLYDVIYILENRADTLNLPHARDLFQGKCRAKQFAPPSAADLIAVVNGEPELRSEWANMLAHQLPTLPPLDALLGRLPELLAWIDVPIPVARLLPAYAPAGQVLVAPAGVQVWRTGVPLEAIRFAGSNRLHISFLYHGKQRIAEPYSFRRASTGNLLLYAFERGGTNIKAFNVAEVQDLRVTDIPFAPRYRIEFTSAGPLSAPSAFVRPRTSPAPRRSRGTAGPSRTRLPKHGPVYVFQCPYCHKEFRHRKNDPALRRHKMPSGYGYCSGRRGYLARTTFT
jgi:predicted nucleotidyltransferase component of viral defense system